MILGMHSVLSFLLLSGLVCGHRVPRPKHREHYDYVIIGGGTSGLVLANRLSEDPSTTVAVIEAGDSVFNNHNVTQIANWFVNLGTDIDWSYPMQPQQYTFNRSLVYDQGKALGGTSTINGGTYIRAERAQIDAWERLGNTGWNWESLWPYYKKSEQFQIPGPELVAKGAEYEPRVHGYHGPVGVGWSNYTMGGDAHEMINITSQNVGLPYNRDQSDGHLHGFSVFPSTMNATLEIRADSARSYYWPIAADRPNLHVFVNTLAEKIVWAEDSQQASTTIAASGVQIIPFAGGASRLIRANKEVILSAGSLKSPVILEHSGVGNPAVLNAHAVPIKLQLDTVGENLQDQTNNFISTKARTPYTGYTPFVQYTTAHDLFGANTSAVAAHVLASVPAYATILAAASNGACSPWQLQQQLLIQTDLIFNHSTPVGESLIVPTRTAISAAIWALLPFSRGNVHMSSSSNASAPPLINPNFFTDGVDWDALAQAGLASFVRRFTHTAPLGDLVGADELPDAATVPTGATVEEWLPFLKETYTSNSHPVGTCAMMSRELGGVVDPELLVYGTSNVRVVDASILPFQIDGHLTSTLYAIAERASDMIKGRPWGYGEL